MSLSPLPRIVVALRSWILAVAHAVIFACAYATATALRFDFAIPAEDWATFVRTLPLVVIVKVVCAAAFGSFHGWMRYVTFHDLVVLLRASLVGSLAVVVGDYALFPGHIIPRSIFVLDFLLTILMIGGLRSIGRLSREQVIPFLRMRFLHEVGFRQALLVGASPTGIRLAAQIHARPDLKTRIVGLLDGDARLHGRRLSGIPVLGTPELVREHASACGAREVYVVHGALPGKQLRFLVDECRAADLKLKVLPVVEDVVIGHSSLGPHGLRLRDVEINDLLHRDPVRIDDAALGAFIGGRTVFVTGAGGSIGSEICRQLLAYGPKTVVLIDQAENCLFQIDRELQSRRGSTEVVPRIGDVTDELRMRQLFEYHRPDVLFHAAAHKHVPMMEFNPGEALKNNTFGTKVVADLAHEFRLHSFVLISTDKAVHPTSVMGLTKQLAERYVHALSQSSTTRFVAVRFGNVLGSVGSVVPIFQQQIRDGGPITVTHPEMRRYFMTIPEASQLVMQAGAMGKGGEIFVLDMGEPVKIVDLARDLIRLSGLSPDDIDIEFTGMRPGEKLFEELYFDEEETLPTPHPKLRVAYHRLCPQDELVQLFRELHALTREPDSRRVVQRLKELVPECPLGDKSDMASPRDADATGDLLAVTMGPSFAK